MNHAAISHFKRTLNFFKWLSKSDNVCDVCGVEAHLVASVFNAPAKPIFSGSEVVTYGGDKLWICQQCWDNLTAESDNP